MNPSTAIAAAIVDELIAGGVSDAVLAPGSRNAPLSIALYRADRAGRIRLHVRIDERTAGFLGLGLAKASARPVVVVTTSGTAVANLHPAVIEADLSGVPLIVLSADRPPWMRDVGANQVVDQVRMFGNSLRFFHEFESPVKVAGQNGRWRSMVCRALAHATGAGGQPGPVQLNMCLAEPLLPDTTEATPDPGWPESLAGRGEPWTVIVPSEPDSGATIAAPRAGDRTLFLADLTHPLAAPLADAGHLVISEAAGAAGKSLLASGFHLLGDRTFMAANRPDRVIVLGRPTLSRPVTTLLTSPAVAVDMVAPAAGWRGLAGNVRRLAPRLAPVGDPDDSEWSEVWRRANARLVNAIGDHVDRQPISASPALARELVCRVEDGTLLVIGSSQSARDIGLATVARNGIARLANRGAAGIDGTVSTAIGAALAHHGPTVALIGDLTLLHDLTGLVIGPAEPRPELTIVVSNNDGGGIFSTLEPGEPMHSDAFERVFGTPHGADLAPMVRGAGHRHVIVASRDELGEALSTASGITVIEVRTDRRGLSEFLAGLSVTVGTVLGSAL